MLSSLPVEHIILDPNGEVYLKFPLGNVDYLSKENWKLARDPVIFDTFEENLGHDLIVVSAGDSFGHMSITPSDTDDLNSLYNKYQVYQKPYVIGKNDFVYRYFDDKGFVWGRYHVTNQRAKEYYKNIRDTNQEIPYHNSAMLIMNPDEDTHNIKHFKVIHNALASDPKFGNDSKMRAICIGKEHQCAPVLLAAGNAVEPCNDTKRLYNNFFSTLQDYIYKKSDKFYILSAGNKIAMSDQEQPKPGEENGGEGGGGGEGGSSSGNEKKQGSPIDFDMKLKDQVKQQIETALTNMKNEEKKPEQKPDTKNEDYNIPRHEVDKRFQDLEKKYEGIIKGLETKIDTQNQDIASYKQEKRGQNIGTLLLQYQDMFKGKDGKVDSELFDKTLKYWVSKDSKEEDIQKDMENSFAIAKNYLSNYSPPTEISDTIIRKQPEQEQKQDDRSYREKMMDKIEEEKLKVGANNEMETPKVVKAGNDTLNFDSVEQKYQETIQKHRNGGVVNNNNVVY